MSQETVKTTEQLAINWWWLIVGYSAKRRGKLDRVEKERVKESTAKNLVILI